MSPLEKLLAALAVLPFGIGLTLSGDAPVKGDVVFSFADPEIIESSGLVAHDGRFATVNDSGDSGRVFTVDPADGSTVAETSWDGEPVDVESMALTPDGDVLVGDTGDNTASRDSIELIRVPFGQDGAVDPTTYELVYPDGSHDCETLLVHPRNGQVLVVAKEFIGRLYAGPEQLSELDEDDPNQLTLVHDELLPIATDGAFFPDGKHFILRGYVKAAVYAWPSIDPVGEPFFLPDQAQGEGLAVGKDGSVYLSSEGTNSDVLQINLPKAVQAELDGRPDHTDKPDSSGPVSDDTLDDDPAYDWSDLTRPLWPWAIGGAIVLVVLLVLLRLRRQRS